MPKGLVQGTPKENVLLVLRVSIIAMTSDRNIQAPFGGVALVSRLLWCKIQRKVLILLGVLRFQIQLEELRFVWGLA